MGACCTPGRGEDLPAEPSADPGRGGSGLRERAVTIPAQTFLMGSDDGLGLPEDEEAPAREVQIREFAIDPYAVRVGDFAPFVEQTGYRTDAERFGWSHVFYGLLPEQVAAGSPRPASAPWWCAVRGADWRHPSGPASEAVPDHPVTHISHRDASAFAAWAGGRLPTEAEWECAARGGLVGARYPWGDDAPSADRVNIWRGDFPHRSDGPIGTVPVDSYAPNGYGLHNASGNVWEWCADDWRGGKVLRGGSYLCHDSYCNRYRVAARTANEVDASSGHCGFRLAW